jgi:hypothetical protein
VLLLVTVTFFGYFEKERFAKLDFLVTLSNETSERAFHLPQ